ncbi:MAG: hypothetical protein R2941_01200 [Desulfobacterales bacterium]
METSSERPAKQWHRLFVRLIEEVLIPVGFSVTADAPVMSQSPEADILLIRKESDEQHPEQRNRLPDGMRESSASHMLIEFKYTESVNENAFRQILGYDTFYRRTNRLTDKELQSFVISAKIPQERVLTEFGYAQTETAGVYRSTNPLLKKIPLLSLNELSNEPHNVYVKCFASRRKEKQSAFDTLRQSELKKFDFQFRGYVDGLWCLWFDAIKGGYDMKTELTPEKISEMGRKWFDMVFSTLPAEEVMSRYRPEDRLKGLRPEDRLKGLRSEDLLKNLRPEEIEAYLKKIRKKTQ